MLPSYTCFVSLLLIHLLGICNATKFTLVNQCTYTVWPATLSSAGTPSLPATATGFSLLPGSNSVIPVPPSWSGRVWARTGCSTGQPGNFSCTTGDCGTGSVQCSGSGGAIPATLVEFTLDGSNGLDFYDVSLVDGYNLPLVVRPVGGSGNCSAAGCEVDLNGSCPAQLRVVISGGAYSTGASASTQQSVACKSACEAFGDPEYCCSGNFSNPNTCKPSTYSEFFKAACPTAYSYAYDDATSTFTCAGADYVITFCPSPQSIGKSSGSTQSPEESVIPPDYFDYNASSSIIPSLTTLSVLLIMLVWSLSS